jgi:hypothetical protein
MMSASRLRKRLQGKQRRMNANGRKGKGKRQKLKRRNVVNYLHWSVTMMKCLRLSGK